MSPASRPDSILAHPALAGRTLYVRTGGSWAAHDIQPQGELGPVRPSATDPTEQAWRGGPLR